MVVRLSFSIGDKVEAPSDEEGFEEVWYEAQVVRVMSRAHRYKVVYDALLADSSPQPRPVQGTIRASHVRPRPPRETGPGSVGLFEIHEPVDALHNNGWWVGVVTAVQPLGDGGGERRYTVYFPNTREEMEFRSSDLRAHLEWVDCMWITPVLKGTSQAAFAVGRLLEVKRNTGESLTTWFAAIVIKHIWKKNYLLEYRRLRVNGSKESLKEIVDCQYLRPLPPPTPDDLNFDLLQEVEVFHNDGWCVGVISKVLSTLRYIVKSEHWEEGMEFRRSNIRLPHGWVNNSWVQASKSHAKSMAFKANASDHNTTSSDCCDEATVLKSKSEKGSTSQSQISASLTYKKPKIGETLEDDTQLVDSSMLTKGTKSQARVERGFCSATETLLERRESHVVHSITEGQCVSEICSKGKSAESLDVDSPSYPTPGDCNNGPSLSAKFIQEALVQKVPTGIIELSMSGECLTNIECEGSERKSKGPTYHYSSVSPEIEDVYERRGKCKVADSYRINYLLRKRKVVTQHPKQRKKRKAVTQHPKQKKKRKEMRGLSEENKRPRGRPPKARMVDMKVLLEGPQLRQLGETNQVAVQEELTAKEDERFVKGVSVDMSSVRQQHCHGNEVKSAIAEVKNLTEEVEMFAKGTSGNLLDDNALDLRQANEQIVDKEDEEPSNLSHIVSQLKTGTKGDTSIKDQGQEISDVTVSSNERLKETSRSDIHCGGVARSIQNEVLKQPVDGVTEKEMTIYDPISSNVTWPFVKTSCVWEYVDAMEVFRTMPQQPHFYPLRQYGKELREGMALGLMVTFANLVAHLQKMQIVDHRDTFQERLNTLIHLEGHGFNVQGVHHHLEGLLRIKDQLAQSEKNGAALGGLILERQNEGQRITEKIDAIDKAVTEWEECIAISCKRRAVHAMEKETIEAEIARLKMNAEAVKQARVSAERDFDVAVSTAAL